MASVLLSCLLVLCALLPILHADMHECEQEEQDPTVYLFGYGYSFRPYEYLNDDGELMGLGYDITRTVCKVMKKRCEHAVYYDYSMALTSNVVSEALNNDYYSAVVSWVPTPARESAYAFFGEYAKEPEAFMYVRLGSSKNTVDKVKGEAGLFGFRAGFRTDRKCLENYLGMSLSGKDVYYNDFADMEEALNDGKVDVLFLDESEAWYMSSVSRVGGVPISCASGGMSIMARKDRMQTLAWYEEGLQKLMDNGDYKWLCDMNRADGDPGCFDKYVD